MREIKFRAWDKVYKHFHEGDLIRDYHIGEFIDNPEYEVTQYTGLKDKNGKEIYEGDVIKVPSINDHVHGNYSYKEIIYRNGTWIAQYIESEKGQVVPKGYMAGHLIDCYDHDYKALVFYDDRLEHTDIEVVGNIYENQTK
ncbi:TPA: YopX family protein [Bacillus tropicus]